MIPRETDKMQLLRLIREFPVTAILGPRQCGKTTLARQIRGDRYFDLENPRDAARLENPQLALENLEGLIVIDEVQRAPALFPLLRYLVDTHPNQKYLLLGSASRELVTKTSESLAGRIAFHNLGGFRIEDVGEDAWRDLWVRGGLPRSFLAESDEASARWRENYVATFLERDIPQLGIAIPSGTLRRFWIMISHYHGQTLNYSEVGRSFGVSDYTVRKYIDILEGTFMVRLLQPWYSNVGKRLVRSPKLYLRDSGIFHFLQGLGSMADIQAHPKLGASWEGFALEHGCRVLGKRPEEMFFWGTHGGAEIDLFWRDGGKNLAMEFKYADAPRLTRSMTVALDDLDIHQLWVVYPGGESYPLEKRVKAVPITKVKEELGR